MNVEELDSIRTDLREVATQHHLAGVEAFLDDAEPPNPVMTVVVARNCQPPQFLDWLKTVESSFEIVRAAEDGTSIRPLSSQRVIAIFQCGEPVDPDDVPWLELLVTRPRGSYFIVFVGAEAIDGKSDLARVERAIARSIPTAPNQPTRAVLADRSIALWAHERPAGDLEERLSTDEGRLTSWLTQPPTEELLTELTAVCTAEALAMAKVELEKTQAQTTIAGEGKHTEALEINRLRQALTEADGRAATRLAELERVLLAEVRSQHAAARETFLAELLGRDWGSDSLAATEERIGADVLELEARLDDGVSRAVASTESDARRQLTELFESDVDWTRLTQVDGNIEHPREIVEAAINLQLEGGVGFDQQVGMGGIRRRRSLAKVAGAIVGGVTGVGAAAVVTGATYLVPVVVAGTIAGSLVGKAADDSAYEAEKNQRIAALSQQIRASVNQVTDETVSEIGRRFALSASELSNKISVLAVSLVSLSAKEDAGDGDYIRQDVGSVLERVGDLRRRLADIR